MSDSSDIVNRDNLPPVPGNLRRKRPRQRFVPKISDDDEEEPNSTPLVSKLTFDQQEFDPNKILFSEEKDKQINLRSEDISVEETKLFNHQRDDIERKFVTQKEEQPSQAWANLQKQQNQLQQGSLRKRFSSTFKAQNLGIFTYK